MGTQTTRAAAAATSEEAYWVIGGLYTFKAVGKDNGNEYTLIEVRAADGFAIPLHFHEHENEAFYVVEGRVTFVIGDETIAARAGSFIIAKRGVTHAFRFASADAKLLLLFTPWHGDHEGLFREMGEPAPRRELPPPPDSPPDVERLAAIAARHGTRIVGPPPGP